MLEDRRLSINVSDHFLRMLFINAFISSEAEHYFRVNKTQCPIRRCWSGSLRVISPFNFIRLRQVSSQVMRRVTCYKVRIPSRHLLMTTHDRTVCEIVPRKHSTERVNEIGKLSGSNVRLVSTDNRPRQTIHKTVCTKNMKSEMKKSLFSVDLKVF